ncbi:phage tail tape measure protein [uncultured Ruminococcus sp.]|uniref:phage tail tape measure protein n=1 Tax=uncultured Ruminococcus sp. TaxID=165186 RepID=UPI00266F76E2|nr:phage tail tape measure protein [uncultured Ruminococcus sp.]
MANRIKGITVEIGGDTTKLSKALEGVNKDIKGTQTQLKDVQKLLKLDPSNTELLSQKHKLLADAVTATKEKLEVLKTAAEQANTALANGEISQQQYDALQREIIETENELKRLTTEANNSHTALEKMGVLGETLQSAGDKISGVGQKLLPVTAGVTALGTIAVKTGADFDSAMSKVAAVSGATGSEMDALREKAHEMGSKTKFSASEAADAMNYMAMAGWKTNDMLSGIEGIMNLAAASGEDLASTSDIVTDALTAFGLSASDSGHFADILAAASSNANTNVSMMGETFKYAAPVLGSLGYSAEDSAIAIGLMANAGIKSSQAGTALRSAITNLAKPTDTVASAMEQYGISLTDSSGKMYSLRELMEQLRQKLGGLSEAEQAQAAASLFGKEAMSGMLAIINGSPADFEKLSNAIDTCSDTVDGYNGTTEKMAAVMQDNLAGQVTILKSQLEELAISFSDILMPTIRSIVSRIQELVDKLNQLDPQTKETIAKIALVAAALGPMLVVLGKTISSVGTVFSAVSKLPALFSAVQSGIGAITGALGVSLGPLLAIIAAVATLVAAFVHLWKTNDEFKSNIIAIWEQIKSTFTGLTQGITDRLNALGFDFESFTDVLKAAWDGLCNLLAPIFEGVFQNISNIFSGFADILLNSLDVLIGLFTGDWEQCWDGIKGIFTSIWNFVVNSFRNIMNTLKGIANVVLGWFGTSWNEVWTSIKTFFVDTWNSIASFFTGIVIGIRDFFVNIWTGIYTFFSNIFNAIYTVVSTVFQTIYNTIMTVWNSIYETIAPLLDAFKYLFETIFQAIHIIISNVMDWISEKISAIWNAIVSFLTPILEGIKNTFTTIWNAIKSVIDTVLGAIQSVITSVWNAIYGFLSPILNSIKSVVSSVWDSISSKISSIMSTIKSTISSIWDNIKSAVSTKVSGVKTAIQDGFQAAVDWIKGLASDAWNWGADIISGIIDGIKSMINNLADTVTGVADTIRDFLHFSVPDKGPLTDYESWMPDFMKGLADGIDKSKKYVEKAVGGVAKAMQLTMDSDLNYSLHGISGAMLPDSSGGTVNNYYNTDNRKTVNQTNQSPKALSRLEIYRLTRNALHL